MGFNSMIKRTSDLVLATLILIMLAPLMLIIAALVKLILAGTGHLPPAPLRPVWRTDHRLQIPFDERDGRRRQGGAGQEERQPGHADRRFLRRSSLDELPQFINVLQGRMSIVGPRPHAVAHNEQYRKLIKGYMLRHKVKPGITGWAQVNGLRGETETLDKMEARIQYDLDYLRNWSVWLDLWIIVRTVKVVLQRQNAH
jgi:putative colanic acid biosynthesis UDP-glucose lipid carrier transferase